MTIEANASVDLAAYLDRVGYSGSTEPTVSTLRSLVAAHNKSIPFENVDPLMGVPVADLGSAALFDKLVHRRRGGYCYEQNGLMGYVLGALGFDVKHLAGRVVWMNTSNNLPAQTHEVLSVTVPGEDEPWLVDVGFGGQTLTSPIRLDAGPVQQTRHEPYRLTRHEDGYRLEAEIRGEWQPLYIFTTRPQPQIDREVGSWYVSTHPASTFVVGLSVALIADDARWNLRGRNLAIHSGGRTEKRQLGDAAEVLDVLTERFGIDLDDLGDRTEVEKRVSAVLDS
ncbi:arylamine N-acetyltransferase family protein [Mycobacterium deserti]|uniref:Arylamine N-acetyltransferase n=1 Tax=Mycobacterium deserti TaxID=2978347 RepID=A0ABT2MAC7_9MYCO|nr:arylamine N-acetyltransferase [Mycobacterium deserti]MCT7658871.1 arylamine N-acetyltransferase [Mycobacterium deserti]